MPRQARLDSPGTLHHVMIRGIEKRRIVDDDWDRRDFARRLGTLAEETRTPICRSCSFGNSRDLRSVPNSDNPDYFLLHSVEKTVALDNALSVRQIWELSQACSRIWKSFEPS